MGPAMIIPHVRVSIYYNISADIEANTFRHVGSVMSIPPESVQCVRAYMIMLIPI